MIEFAEIRIAHVADAEVDAGVTLGGDGNMWFTEQDRNAIVLRFFENLTPQEAAAALKLNEVTARKRVSRALEKLRTFFAKRGVVLTAAVIAGTISGNSVQAAPAAVRPRHSPAIPAMTHR